MADATLRDAVGQRGEAIFHSTKRRKIYFGKKCQITGRRLTLFVWTPGLSIRSGGKIMTITENWILAERAVQLAIVHLTRRDDLIVTPATADDGIDLLITITQRSVRTGRIFGIQVKGHAALPIVTNGAPDTYTFTIPTVAAPTLIELPFPLCLFIFAMDSDLGYYRWLVEPRIAADQPPSLRVNPKQHFTLLTKAALDQLVLQVNRWYDAKGRS